MRKHHYKLSTEGEAELAVTTFLNLMVVLVPFLLITAVFSRMTIVELNLPSAAGGPSPDEIGFRPEVIVREGGIEVTNGADVIAAMPKVNGEYDLAFGSRALDRSLIGTHQPWRREQGGKVMNLIIRTLSGLNFYDTQCGFKAFNMKKFRPLLDVMTVDRFGFDVEFLFVANYHKLRLKEIPVRWNNVEGSKVSVLRDTRRMIGELSEIRRNARRGTYDI